MKPTQAAKTAAQRMLDPFETLGSQVAKPMLSDSIEQLFGKGFGGLSSRPQSMAGEDLARARQEKAIQEQKAKDEKESEQNIAIIKQNIYKEHTAKTNNEQAQLRQEVVELTGEVVQLAKAAGVETKIHLERLPQKIGPIDIRRLTFIIKTLRLKAEESKSGSELVNQRTNAKATGMLAWVSGKQMKIHEQGTMQLQG